MLRSRQALKMLSFFLFILFLSVSPTLKTWICPAVPSGDFLFSWEGGTDDVTPVSNAPVAGERHPGEHGSVTLPHAGSSGISLSAEHISRAPPGLTRRHPDAGPKMDGIGRKTGNI